MQTQKQKTSWIALPVSHNIRKIPNSLFSKTNKYIIQMQMHSPTKSPQLLENNESFPNWVTQVIYIPIFFHMSQYMLKKNNIFQSLFYFSHAIHIHICCVCLVLHLLLFCFAVFLYPNPDFNMLFCCIFLKTELQKNTKRLFYTIKHRLHGMLVWLQVFASNLQKQPTDGWCFTLWRAHLLSCDGSF